MASPLLRRSLAALQRLLDGRFAALAANPAAASSILQDVLEFYNALWDARERGERPDEATLDGFVTLCAMLCTQLESLDAPLQQHLLGIAVAARRGQAAAAEQAGAVRGQVAAAASALRGCVIAAEYLRFSPPALQQVQRGFALVFGSGRSALQSLLTLQPPGPPPGQAARNPNNTRQPLPHELPTRHDLAVRASQANYQLNAVYELQVLQASQPAAATLAAFNAGTGAPSRVVPWLAAAAELLLAAGGHPTEGLPLEAHRIFAAVCREWLARPGLTHLHAPLQAAGDGTALRRLAQLLLHGLAVAADTPLMPAGADTNSQHGAIDAFHIGALLEALTASVLAPALLPLLAGTAGLPAVRHAAQLAARLPLDAPLPEEGSSLQGLPAEHLRTTAQRHIMAMHLFVRLAQALRGGRQLLPGVQPGAQQPLAFQPAGAEVQAAAAEAVHLAARVPPLLQLFASPAMQAVFPEALVQSSPCVTELLLLTAHTQSIGSAEQMGAWCGLADQLLQLVPLAVSVAGGAQAQPLRRQQGVDQQQQLLLQQFSAQLPNRCLGVWGQAVRMSRACVEQQGGPLAGAPAATLAALGKQFWALHARACRLVHFCAGATSQQLQAAPQLADWERNVCRLGFTFSAASGLLSHAVGASSGAERAALDRLLGSLCAAHLAALEAAALPPSLLEPGLPAAELAEWTAQAAAGAPRAALGPRARELLQQAGLAIFRDRAASSPNDLAHIEALEACLWSSYQLALQCSTSVHLTAELLASGCFAALLRVVRSFCSDPAIQALFGQSGLMGQIVLPAGIALSMLGCAGVDAAGAASAAGDAATNSRLLGPAEALIVELGQSSTPDRLLQLGPAEFVAGMEEALPTAREVAAELQAWWAQPAQKQAAQLELAHACAPRACAYLRCANLGVPGGMEARQQPGSRRCGGCRVVRYCGERCSHADWAAGHRRVCKALAAAQQEAEE